MFTEHDCWIWITSLSADEYSRGYGIQWHLHTPMTTTCSTMRMPRNWTLRRLACGDRTKFLFTALSIEFTLFPYTSVHWNFCCMRAWAFSHYFRYNAVMTSSHHITVSAASYGCRQLALPSYDLSFSTILYAYTVNLQVARWRNR